MNRLVASRCENLPTRVQEVRAQIVFSPFDPKHGSPILCPVDYLVCFEGYRNSGSFSMVPAASAIFCMEYVEREVIWKFQ